MGVTKHQGAESKQGLDHVTVVLVKMLGATRGRQEGPRGGHLSRDRSVLGQDQKEVGLIRCWAWSTS